MYNKEASEDFLEKLFASVMKFRRQLIEKKKIPNSEWISISHVFAEIFDV